MRFFGISADILCDRSAPVCSLLIKFNQNNLESSGFQMYSNKAMHNFFPFYL